MGLFLGSVILVLNILMDDKQIETFLRLKFSNVDTAIKAFRKATGMPDTAPEPNIIKVLKEWVRQGAPKHLDVPDDRITEFLILKYGSMDNAYYMWLQDSSKCLLTLKESAVVIDYIPKKPKAKQ